MGNYWSNLYRERLFPRIEAFVTRGLGQERGRVLKPACGRVLEIGIGSGHNLSYLPACTDFFAGLEPSRGFLRLASNAANGNRNLQLIRGTGESLPFAENSFDTVVSFLVLCSVRNLPAVLTEIYRVLRPGGRLLYFEHVRASDPVVARWQDRLTPLWAKIGCGCHLNRPTEREIAAAGFQFQNARRYRSDRLGPSITAEVIEGVACKP